MKDKTKGQLINDLRKLRQRIAKLEELENKCRRIEKALQKSEKRLNMIADNMLDVISQTDSDGVFQYVSPSIKDLLGYEPEDITISR